MLNPLVDNAEKGGEMQLKYTCEPCGYDFFSSLVHAQGQAKAIGSTAKAPPEILPKK